MSSVHPDYRAAKSELASIYAKIQTANAYKTKEDLCEDFNNWIQDFTTVCHPIAYSAKEKISFLGIQNLINYCLLTNF